MARRTFTLEFKTSAARLVRDQGYSVAQAAQSLGSIPVRSATGLPSSHPCRLRHPPTATPISARSSSGFVQRTGGSSWSAKF